MITINNIQYRNLTEQVQKNKEDIARHYEIDRVIADFGIRILGRLDSVDDLPAQGALYGDAYAIGTETPYDYWVWTRANEAIGEPVDYWMDIGSLAIPGPTGPQGPQGIQGPQGTPGSKWTSGQGKPVSITATTGDQYLDTLSGIVYEWTGAVWEARSSIKGPQGEPGPIGSRGEQGPQGIQGPIGFDGKPGKTAIIAGVLNSVDLLPSPADLNDLSLAYLIGTGSPYRLYVQVGETPATAQWFNTGNYTTGTSILANGVLVSSVGIDTSPTANSNNLVRSGDIYNTITAGQLIPLEGDRSNYQLRSTGSTTNAQRTVAIGNGVVCHSSFTQGFGRGITTNKQNQTVIGSFSVPDSVNELILASGDGGNRRKNAFTASYQSCHIMSSPLTTPSPRNMIFVPNYDAATYNSLETGDVMCIYSALTGEITRQYVKQ